MDAIDLERIGVEHHQAEVGLAAADDDRLQAERGVAADRIEPRLASRDRRLARPTESWLSALRSNE